MRHEDQDRVVIVGAGMAGLSAALRLAAAGRPVLVVEAADEPGGKLRRVNVGDNTFDAGPTVLTMKWVFDDLLSCCSTRLEDEIALQKADVLARHYWRDGACLDLFSDPEATVRAIGDFAGRCDAEGYRRFAADSRRVFSLLQDTFIDATRPNPVSLAGRIGLSRPGALLAIKPFATLWGALGDYFPDRRLRQLFGRYATYCGSSPFLAPATLMLVAHVEQDGVWIPSGGMHGLARCIERLAIQAGARFRYGARVEAILCDKTDKTITGVRLETGETLAAGQVIFNGDNAALPNLLGKPAVRRLDAAKGQRSLSALVACGMARPEGVPLAHHTVFFSDDYESEFDAIFSRRVPPEDPTVYVCAQDRDASGRLRVGLPDDAGERIYCLMNMPADGDRHTYSKRELDQCLTMMDRRLAMNGMMLHRDPEAQVVAAPDTFEMLYPATGGSLYGPSSHGWMASFSRSGSRGPVRGLYLAGGSVHPGPGVPMAALSGKIAAMCLMADQDSTGRSRPVAIAGGTRTPQATAGSSR
jgi:1-hydroxycarotenoid 3,4-desaturase